MEMYTFDQLCGQIGLELGLERVRLASEEVGESFRFEVEKLPVTLLHMPERSPAFAFVLLDFGSADLAAGDAAFREMLATNFEMMTAENPPVLSLNPITGHVQMHFEWPLDGRPAAMLLDRIRGAIENSRDPSLH